MNNKAPLSNLQRAGNQTLESYYSIYTTDNKCFVINVSEVSKAQTLKELVAVRLKKVGS